MYNKYVTLDDHLKNNPFFNKLFNLACDSLSISYELIDKNFLINPLDGRLNTIAGVLYLQTEYNLRELTDKLELNRPSISRLAIELRKVNNIKEREKYCCIKAKF